MDMSRAEVTSLRASVLKALLRLLRLGGLDIILLRGFVEVLKALLRLLRLAKYPSLRVFLRLCYGS